MTPQEFIHKWQAVKLSERSACQQHFLDLCELLGQPKPAAADPDGTWYTFERGVHKTDGEQGWADVWMQDHFGWEYKGKHKDLVAAYKQLLQYREDLGNPPLLVVCDMDRFQVHTNFTNTAKKVYEFGLDGLAEPKNLDVLRKLFTEPEALRPGQTTAAVTEQASELIGQIVDGMRVRNIDPHDAAHFMMKLMFSMFAEDIGLLKDKIFSKIVQASAKPGATNAASQLSQKLRGLFEAMSKGGSFGADDVPYFNGGLFNNADVIDLRVDEIQKLRDVAILDWSNVEPSVFGTLFERILDPAKRSQIGAHYTSREDILLLLEPVVMMPLRREWAEVRAKCEALVPKIQAASLRRSQARAPKPDTLKPFKDFNKLIDDFQERLTKVRILDPACGSGNFLYLALKLLLDLEKEVITYGSRYHSRLLPEVRPTQMAGLEINPYAHELASVVIWIGYIQWMHDNGFTPKSDPVLEPIETIKQMDAILDLREPEHPREPAWPSAEFIVGNPPFLGGKLLRSNLGDHYVDALFYVWGDRVRPEADLCCYWFERARHLIEKGKTSRAGLLATQGVRGGANRETLKRIKTSGDIFFAESDRQWFLDGANVHISMIGFDRGADSRRILNGQAVAEINSNLSGSADITLAKKLPANASTGFMGDTKGGAFDIEYMTATRFLCEPNPNLKCNSDVLVPWTNGLDLTRRPREMWIIDFPLGMTLDDAAQYASPFAHLERHVRPQRLSSRSKVKDWWIHERPRVEMREALSRYSRFICTPIVSKYRLFVWMESPNLADHQLVAFAFSDDWSFGVLHSRVHEQWALKLGTRLETRPRYTPTTSFESFPFPKSNKSHSDEVAANAHELDQLRNNWLNPPEWTTTEVLEFPGTVGGPWDRYIDPATVRTHPSPNPSPSRGGGQSIRIGTVKYPRIVARDEASAAELKKRTLTNLYNERPTWLDLAHKRLDEAVFAAYGWSPTLSDEELLAKLLELNLARAAEEASRSE